MNKVEYSKKYRLEHKGDIKFWFTKTYGRLKRDNKNKFNLYNSQIEDNNITYYKTVYHDILDFRGDSAVRPQYLDIE